MLETLPRTRYAFALLAYSFAAIMVGTTLPTPMYALYADHMHFAVLTTTVIYATYAGGVLFALVAVRAVVRRDRQAPDSARRRCVRARQRRRSSWSPIL